jgi:hypothetical protein
VFLVNVFDSSGLRDVVSQKIGLFIMELFPSGPGPENIAKEMKINFYVEWPVCSSPSAYS